MTYAPIRKNKKGQDHACGFECGCTWTIEDWHEMSRRDMAARLKREEEMGPIWGNGSGPGDPWV